jgi:hypothetical protein
METSGRYYLHGPDHGMIRADRSTTYPPDGLLARDNLRRILTRYFVYYHRARTHLALQKDAPDGRPIERPEVGTVVQIPESAVYIIATPAGQHNPASTGPRPATNVLPR